MNELIISNITIRQDEHGRYCLNDLHRASGGDLKNQPANWLRSKQTEELIEQLVTDLTDPQIRGSEQNQPLSVIKGGNNQGTYVCKELVYAYTMWISSAFHLKVIRAYDAMVTQSTKQQSNPLYGRTPTQALGDAATTFKELYAVAQLIGCDSNAAAISANNMVTQTSGLNILAGFGKTHLTAERQDTFWYTPTQLGDMLPMKVTAREVNKRLESAGLQEKDGTQWKPTDAASGKYRVFDTSKRHNSGVPVSQIKWSEDVVKLLTQGVLL
jgi:hypothetical protein